MIVRQKNENLSESLLHCICLMVFEWVDLVLDWLGIRDRPFNLKGVGGGGGLWFFVSFRIFSSDNTRGRIFFFVTGSAKFFSRI